MAYELIRPGHQLPVPAASAILPRQAVTLVGTSGLMAIPAGSSNVRPFGFNGGATGGPGSLATPVTAPGEVITIYEESNIVKCKAGASLGVGAECAVGSTNGTLAPYGAGGGASLFAASGHWAVGIAMTPAAADETFSLYVKPRKA